MNWYFNKDLKPQGPFEILEIRGKITRGELSPFDLLLNEVTNEWKMAIEHRDFERTLFPALQDVQFDKGETQWVILRGETQDGPYSQRQIEQKLLAHEISSSSYIWKAGLSGWALIKDRPEFRPQPGEQGRTLLTE